MEQVLDLLQLVSLATIVVAYAAVEAGSFAVKKDADGKLPGWFVLIPIIVGFVFAPIEFFAMEDYSSLNTGKILATILFRGFIASAASVLTFELRKRYGGRLWNAVGDKIPFRKKDREGES